MGRKTVQICKYYIYVAAYLCGGGEIDGKKASPVAVDGGGS